MNNQTSGSFSATTADNGEQECREAFEQWVLESWDATHLRTDRVGTYVCLHIFLKWQAWQVAWSRRPTNEGQDGLTDDEIFKVLKSIDPTAVRLPQGFRDFARAITRHLSSKQPEKLTDLTTALSEIAKRDAALVDLLDANKRLADEKAELRARELEIIEACKAVALSYSDKAAELFPTNGTVDAWLQECAAVIDKLKGEL